MAQLKDLIVNGPGRILSDLYVQNKIYENGTALEDKYDEIVYVDTTATFSDIYNLKQNGKLPIYKDANGFAFPELVEDSSPSGFTFTKIDDSGTIYWYKVDTADAWTSGTLDIHDLYMCTYGTTTYAQITQALSDGKLPYCYYGDQMYLYAFTIASRYYFSSFPSRAGVNYLNEVYVGNANDWHSINYSYLMSNNLVTSWQATPDDTHYPSEKLVKDSLASKVSEPSSEGTNGQVLTTDGSGGRTWTTVSGGSSSVVKVTFSDTYSTVSSIISAGQIPMLVSNSDEPTGIYTGTILGHGITIHDEGFWHLSVHAIVLPTESITLMITQDSTTYDVTIASTAWNMATHTAEVSSLSYDPYEYPATVEEYDNTPAHWFTSTLNETQTIFKLGVGNTWTTSDTNVLQPLLVSGTNIKTVNNQTLLGSGNIDASVANQIKSNGQTLRMKSKMYRYRLVFTSADGLYFVPANNSTSTDSTTSRTPCQDAIDPFGSIYIYNDIFTVNAGNTPTSESLYSQGVVTIGYSFAGSSMTASRPVYLKCAPQSDGSVKIYNNAKPWEQTLPNSNDGYVYIFLGVAKSSTDIEILPHHPVYYYDGTKIALWTGGNSGGGTSAVSTSVTLTSSGWSSNTQSVTPSSGGNSIDPSEYDTIIVSPSGDPSNYANAGIYCSSTYYYGMEFTCKNVPTSDIVVNVLLM